MSRFFRDCDCPAGISCSCRSEVEVVLRIDYEALQKQIEALKSELAKERSVIDFYADPKNSGFENKDFDEGDDAELMYYNIVTDLNTGFEDVVLAKRGEHQYEDYMWGKLARQRQRERK